MNRFEVSVAIDQPIAAVWDYLNTVENELVWQASATERVFVTDGPLESGSLSRQVDRFLGRRLETEWEVTELHDYLRQDRTITGPFDMEVEWRLEPVGDGTQFTMTMTSEAGSGGLFGKLADPVLMRIAKREWQNNLEALKDILETEAI